AVCWARRRCASISWPKAKKRWFRLNSLQEKCLARFHEQGIGVAERVVLLNHDHFFGLFALWPLHQFILHHLPFIQSLEAVHLDRGVVDENVSTAFRLLDKAVAFGGVEPFDFA